MGSTLIESITPKAFREFAAAAVDFLKINSVSEKFRHGRPVVVKRRNGNSEKIAESANSYFRLANIPIRFWSNAGKWQRWEVNCFQMLNGDGISIQNIIARITCEIVRSQVFELLLARIFSIRYIGLARSSD